jgi:hypothetical protein
MPRSAYKYSRMFVPLSLTNAGVVELDAQVYLDLPQAHIIIAQISGP